jgi:hypothetical protein
MCTKSEPRCSKYSIALTKLVYGIAGRFNLSGEFLTEDQRSPGPADTEIHSQGEREPERESHTSQFTVPHGYCGCRYFDEDLIVFGRGFFDLLKREHLGGTVPRTDDRSHALSIKAALGFAIFHQQHDTSLFMSGFNVAVCFDNLLQGIAPVNDRSQFARFNQLLEQL